MPDNTYIYSYNALPEKQKGLSKEKLLENQEEDEEQNAANQTTEGDLLWNAMKDDPHSEASLPLEDRAGSPSADNRSEDELE